MYKITCDGFALYDPRDEDLILLNPKCKLAVNTVGEGSFTILANHPNYGKLKKLKSIFEIQQDNAIIFRGRMTNDSRDFYNQLDVDLEGVLGFTNDSIVPPFNFPDDFPNASGAANVVEYFLTWVLEQHNGQVEDWQKLKLGNVTVADPNNIITRSSDSYMSTWEVLKTKLFESALGGYLCVRYEEDGTFIDYLDRFEQTNVQHITFGENLLDITNDSDASETYSAILPLGAKPEGENTQRLTLGSLPDGDLNDDLVKKGNFIYSKSARNDCGWICVPVAESTWDDVTEVENLKTKAMAYLSGTAMLFSNTITIKAVDLYFTDDQIQSFRIYQNILVNSPVHGVIDVSYPLTQLDIDIMNPQNTTITIGSMVRTLIDINNAYSKDTSDKINSVTSKADKESSEISNMQQTVNELSSDTGWIDLVLQDGISVGSEMGYLRGRLKNNILYITGDVTGIANDMTYVAHIPSELIPDDFNASVRIVGAYGALYFCNITITKLGGLYVNSNSSGAWDSTENVSMNISICV